MHECKQMRHLSGSFSLLVHNKKTLCSFGFSQLKKLINSYCFNICNHTTIIFNLSILFFNYFYYSLKYIDRLMFYDIVKKNFTAYILTFGACFFSGFRIKLISLKLQLILLSILAFSAKVSTIF